MLVLPVILILWSSNACSSATQVICRTSQFYKDSTIILPYVMLAGGAIIGYNMKRAYDLAKQESGADDEDEEND
jgi:hypothetical protein